MLNSRWFLIVAVAASVLCFMSQPCVAVNGDRPVVVGLSAEPTGLTPIFAVDSISHDLCRLLYRGLLKLGEDDNCMADAAEDWHIEGQEVTFRLKKGLHWEDGQEVTASDYEYGVKAARDWEESYFRERYADIVEILVLDKYTIKYVFKKGSQVRAEIFDYMSVLPSHLSRDPRWKSAMRRAPIGNGDFRLAKWVPGELIALAGIAGGGVKELAIKIVPDQSAAYMGLRAGEIDVVGVTPQQFGYFENNEKMRNAFYAVSYPNNGYNFIALNLADARLADHDVRRAISLATDRHEILAIAVGGKGELVDSPFSNRSIFYNAQLRQQTCDIKAAIESLVRAGYTEQDAAGIRSKQGRRLSFTVTINAGNPQRERVALVLREQMKKIGVDLRIESLEWGLYLDKVIQRRSFEMALAGRAYAQPRDLLSFLHSGGKVNYLGIHSDRLDNVLEALDQARLHSDIVSKSLAAQEILAEEIPVVFLYSGNVLILVNKRIRGVRGSRLGLFQGIGDWSLAASW